MYKSHIIALTLAGFVAASAAAVQTVEAAHPSFIDSTAYLINPQQVHFGELVYVASFALLKAGTDAAHAIHLGSETNVRGINVDPDCPFNPGTQLPTIHGVPTREPEFRNRIIGNVRTHDDLDKLHEVMGNKISLRADEGFPFEVGR